MGAKDWADEIEMGEMKMDIDFLEIDTVKKIEEFNRNGIDDHALYDAITSFWMAEDGISSMKAFEDVISKYHAVLLEEEG